MNFRSKSPLFFITTGMLLLFLTSAVIGLWVAYDSWLGWPVLLTILISLGLFLIVANSVVSPWRASKGLVVVAGLVAFYFVFQYRHFNFYQAEVGLVPAIGRLTSSFMPNVVIFTPHPNAIASFVEGVLLVSLVVVGHETGRVRWIWLALALVIAYALFISESRGAWLGVAMAMGIWILLIFRERALQLIVIGLGIAAGLLGGIFVVTRLIAPGEYIPLISPTVSTAYSRLTLYENSFRLIQDYPFTGIGLGDTFGMVYSRYQLYIPVPFLSYAHNLFLSVGLGQGLLGLMSFIVLLVLFFTFVIRVERIGIGSESRLMLFRASWLGVTATLLHGLTDSVQFSDAAWTMPVPFVLAGIAVAVGRPVLPKTGDHTKANVPRLRIIQGVVAGVIMVIVLVGAGIFWRPLRASWYANLGAIYHAKADLAPLPDESSRQMFLAQATENFQKALSINPDQPAAHRRLGLMALEERDFETALVHLEQAYAQDPANLGVVRTLGYAYLWTGQLASAENLWHQGNLDRSLVDEMEYWHWFWGTQGQPELAGYAGEMARRLRQ